MAPRLLLPPVRGGASGRADPGTRSPAASASASVSPPATTPGATAPTAKTTPSLALKEEETVETNLALNFPPPSLGVVGSVFFPPRICWNFSDV